MSKLTRGCSWVAEREAQAGVDRCMMKGRTCLQRQQSPLPHNIVLPSPPTPPKSIRFHGGVYRSSEHAHIRPQLQSTNTKPAASAPNTLGVGGHTHTPHTHTPTHPHTHTHAPARMHARNHSGTHLRPEAPGGRPHLRRRVLAGAGQALQPWPQVPGRLAVPCRRREDPTWYTGGGCTGDGCGVAGAHEEKSVNAKCTCKCSLGSQTLLKKSGAGEAGLLNTPSLREANFEQHVDVDERALAHSMGSGRTRDFDCSTYVQPRG